MPDNTTAKSEGTNIVGRSVPLWLFLGRHGVRRLSLIDAQEPLAPAGSR
jgi:hypothetical protein